MEIKFTNHALVRLTERKIKTSQVLTVIAKPDIKTEEESHTAVYKTFGKLALKVVITEGEDEIRVITVHWMEKERLKNLKPIIEGEL